MGLASPVFSRWIAGLAGLVCALPGERVGSLGKVEARELAPPGTHHQSALEAISVSHLADDCHEFRFARHARYVSDFFATLLGIRRSRALGNFGHLDGRSIPDPVLCPGCLGRNSRTPE